MTHFQTFTKKMLSAMMAAALVVPAMATTSYAATTLPTAEGTYSVDAELSLYVNAMGGIEFAVTSEKSTSGQIVSLPSGYTNGANMVTGAKVTVDSAGDANMTISLGSTYHNIYTVDCYGFIDASVNKPGYYTASGEKKEATYTLSDKKLTNSSKADVNYVDSITFPLDEATETYYLYLYMESSTMGKEFTNETVGSVSPATLTVDWDSLEETLPIVDTSTSNAEIVYEYSSEPTYEIEIPKNLDLGTTSNGEGSYNIVLNTAVNFAEGDYITVSAPPSGELVSGTYKTTYTNTLATHKLTKATDSVSGSVKVATPPASGTYKGTLTFTINLHSNSN